MSPAIVKSFATTLTDLIPCNPNASNSICCGLGYECLANGVCAASATSVYNGGIAFIRGLCTDIYWQSSLCPQFCLNAVDSMYTLLPSAIMANIGIIRQYSRRQCYEYMFDCERLVL